MCLWQTPGVPARGPQQPRYSCLLWGCGTALTVQDVQLRAAEFHEHLNHKTKDHACQWPSIHGQVAQDYVSSTTCCSWRHSCLSLHQGSILTIPFTLLSDVDGIIAGKTCPLTR